ncbi:hypothetical protein NL108_001683 [Boleophthalmus pectinirostris]|nr:hypothetical protein NL108_001683 [Boleophthalmus pectinirostris]
MVICLSSWLFPNLLKVYCVTFWWRAYHRFISMETLLLSCIYLFNTCVPVFGLPVIAQCILGRILQKVSIKPPCLISQWDAFIVKANLFKSFEPCRFCLLF